MTLHSKVEGKECADASKPSSEGQIKKRRTPCSTFQTTFD